MRWPSGVWAFGLGGLGLGAACVHGSLPSPAPTVPVGSGGQAAVAGSPSQAGHAAFSVASAEGGEPGAGGGQPDAGPRPDALVVVERPYKLFERPRPRGAVQASVEEEELGRWNVGGSGDPDFVSNRPTFHPGTRVVVQLELAQSRRRSPGLERRYLAHARKYGYWPFRLCFEEGLRKNPRLHGKSEFGVRVDQRGRARAVRLLATRLEDQAVAGCLADRVRELVFAPPARVDLRMTVELWPGDAPIEPAPPSNDLGCDNPGKLDAEAVLAVVRAAQPELARCYEEGLARDPELWGRLELRFDQDHQGRLGRLGEQQSHFPDRRAALCVVDALRGLGWPRPSQGRLSWVLGLRFGHPPQRSKTND